MNPIILTLANKCITEEGFNYLILSVLQKFITGGVITFSDQEYDNKEELVSNMKLVEDTWKTEKTKKDQTLMVVKKPDVTLTLKGNGIELFSEIPPCFLNNIQELVIEFINSNNEEMLKKVFIFITRCENLRMLELKGTLIPHESKEEESQTLIDVFKKILLPALTFLPCLNTLNLNISFKSPAFTKIITDRLFEYFLLSMPALQHLTLNNFLFSDQLYLSFIETSLKTLSVSSGMK